MDSSRFICPHCGKEYDIKDAVIQEQITSEKDGGMKVVGRKIVYSTYVDSVKVRFCPHCARKREFISKWNKIATLVVCLVLCLVYMLLFINLAFKDIMGILPLSIIVWLIPMSIVDALLEKYYFKVDLEKAKEGNAYPVLFNFKH